MTPKKLSDSEKQEIASSYAGGGVTMASLARTFGVSASTVSRVLRQLDPQGGSNQNESASSVKAASPKQGRAPAPAQSTAAAESLSEGGTQSATEAGVAVVGTITSKEPKERKRRSRISKRSLSQETATVTPTVASVVQETDAQEADTQEGAVASPPPSSTTRTKRTRKRTTTARATQVTPADDQEATSDPASDSSATSVPTPAAKADSSDRSRRRVRRRSSARTPAEIDPTDTAAPVHTLPSDIADESADEVIVDDRDEKEDGAVAADGADATPDLDLLEDDLLDDESSLDDDYGDDDDDEDEDDEDEDDGGGGEESLDGDPEQPLQILPFVDVSLPNPCYLVVDRSAELITRPLKDFRELGMVPEDEADLKTLPIFDNHRIARRFSARNQRVIKIPDSTVFLKTGPHLQAKKIVRLLIDGRVYAL